MSPTGDTPGFASASRRQLFAPRPWAWLALPMLLLLVLVLKFTRCPAVFDPPYLKAVLTFVFGTLVALLVVLLMGRTFLLKGQPGLLLLGAGILFLGLGGVVAAAAGGSDANLNVTIFNLCGWLAAVCHLLGALLLLRPRRAMPAPGLWLGLVALFVLSAVGLVVLVTRAGWTPLFFVQGQGGTPVRQAVLGSAITVFALAAMLPAAAARQPLSPFFHWYSLALGLLAIGHLGVLLQPSFGSLLSWTGWAAMCLAGFYLFLAALAALRESRAWGAPLEIALHESEERFQALAHASFEGIAIIKKGRLLDCNEQLLQMLGYRREELLGREPDLLVVPEEQARVLANIRENRESCLEHGVLRKDGSRIIVEARGKPFSYQGRQARVTAIRDITARKQAEQALAQAQLQLQAHAVELEQTVARRTAKLREALGEIEHFSYAITHDMRAPLRAMQGYAELLNQHCGACSQPTNREFFRRIKVATSRMDQLITDSLNYSKAVRHELSLAPVDLHQLLQGLIDTYPNLLPDKADIRLVSDLPVVLGNEAALTQCFGNLLGNAVKFVASGTKPQIRVWAELAPKRMDGLIDKGLNGSKAANQEPSGHLSNQPSIHQSSPPLNVERPPVGTPSGSQPSTLNHPLIRIWVEDNGIGIPEHMRERIFDLFQRVNNQPEGTGLGLAIVRKLVQRMGGEVGVESEPGQGSRFWVELQLAPSTAVK